jgi:hypothetical protein
MFEFWLGLMTACWLFTVGAIGYVLWRYAFKPWTVMRKDILALVEGLKKANERIDNFEHALSPTKVSLMSDEQLASVENRLRMARKANG